MPSRKKILIVDEDAAVRESLARALTLENCHVLAAASASEGLAKASAVQIDATVFDLDRPDQHRWQAVRQVTAKNPSSRKIGMTARFDRSALADAAGLDTLLQKPFEISALLDALAVNNP